jgi:hypothetical protein
MADFTASTGLRDTIAANLATCYYWLTLHDATGGFAAADVYAAGVRGELATGAGYTRGAKTVTLTNTNGVLDGANATWTTGAGETLGPASYCALWINTTNTVTGAKLVSVDDSSLSAQTASNGGTMTAGITNPITIPTPA